MLSWLATTIVSSCARLVLQLSRRKSRVHGPALSTTGFRSQFAWPAASIAPRVHMCESGAEAMLVSSVPHMCDVVNRRVLAPASRFCPEVYPAPQAGDHLKLSQI